MLSLDKIRGIIQNYIGSVDLSTALSLCESGRHPRLYTSIATANSRHNSITSSTQYSFLLIMALYYQELNKNNIYSFQHFLQALILSASSSNGNR